MTDSQLILELARLLASLRGRPGGGYHGSGRHIGQDLDLCGAYDGSDGTTARPCSARCAAVNTALEQAAAHFAITAEDLLGWPKRIKALEPQRPQKAEAAA